MPVLARVTAFLAQTILGNVSQQSIVQLGLSFNDYTCQKKKPIRNHLILQTLQKNRYHWLRDVRYGWFLTLFIEK